MSAVSVSKIMSPEVCTVSADSPVEEVVALMRHNNYSCVVVEQNKRPQGIVTERDVLRLTNLLLQGTDASNIKVASIMTSPVISIRITASLHEAMMLCRDKKIRHMPVVDKSGELAGIITQSDLMSGYFHLLENMVQPMGQSDSGDAIGSVDLDEVEQDLKDLFKVLQTHNNPDGSKRLSSRFV